MRYAIVDTSTGSVVNVILLDEPPTDPTMGLGNNFQAIQNDAVNIGWTLINGVLTDTLPPAPVVVPHSVTSAQAIRALYAAGKLVQVQSVVAAADPLTQALWSHASEFDRNDPVITSLATQIGWASSDLDALFIAAAKL